MPSRGFAPSRIVSEAGIVLYDERFFGLSVRGDNDKAVQLLAGPCSNWMCPDSWYRIGLHEFEERQARENGVKAGMHDLGAELGEGATQEAGGDPGEA